MSDLPDRRCWISLGGNVGNVRQTFDDAVNRLEHDFKVTLGAHSALYQTTPVGNQSTAVYTNAVCEIITRLPPRELLRALQDVESQLGRVRDVRWGARPIDLDLLSYSDQVIHEIDLIVPHPGIVYRRFVLDPLVEASPRWEHPELHVTAVELVSRLSKRPLLIQFTDVPSEEANAIQSAIAKKFADVKFNQGVTVSAETICLGRNPQTTTNKPTADRMSVIDLSRIPGTTLERVESVLTAIFDSPHCIADW